MCELREEFQELENEIEELEAKISKFVEDEKVLNDSNLYKLVKSDDFENLHPLMQEFAQGMHDWYKEKHPRRRKLTIKRMGKEYGDEFWDFVKEASRVPVSKANGFRDKINDLKKRQREIAKEVELRPSEEFIPAWFVSRYTYSSQGYGDLHYAEGYAKLQAECARKEGLEVKVKANKEKERYDALVAVHPDDVKFLRLRRPGLSMEEFVNLCDEYTVNPRVYSSVKWKWIRMIRNGEWPPEEMPDGVPNYFVARSRY